MSGEGRRGARSEVPLLRFNSEVGNISILDIALKADQLETHQQRHDELVQVNHLDAAHIQFYSAISSGGVGVPSTLRGVWSQTHGKAEHLITHNGDGLQERMNSKNY